MTADKERNEWIANLLHQQRLSNVIKSKPGKPITVDEKTMREYLRMAWDGGAIQRNEHIKKATTVWP